MARRRLLDESSTHTLANVAFFLGTPALLFKLLWQADLGMIIAPHLAVSCAAIALSSLLYVGFELLWFRRGISDAVMGVFGSSYVNAANIGIPLSTYVLGDPTWSVPILLLQMGVLQPLGLAVLDIQQSRSDGRRISGWRWVALPVRNPVTVAAAGGLLANVVDLRLPSVVVGPLDLVAQLAVPTMLVAFGISLYTGGLPGTAPHTRQAVVVSLLKLVVMPLLAWLLARAFGFDPATTFAVTVLAGLPTAQNVFTNAVRYRVSVGLARDVVFFTTILSIPTMLAIALLAHA